MESLVSNRFDGKSAEFLIAMAELCSLPSDSFRFANLTEQMIDDLRASFPAWYVLKHAASPSC